MDFIGSLVSGFGGLSRRGVQTGIAAEISVRRAAGFALDGSLRGLAAEGVEDGGRDAEAEQRAGDSPPTMTTATGCRISLPGWSAASTSGMRPMPAASAVMSTGTSRSFVPRMTISLREALRLRAA